MYACHEECCPPRLKVDVDNSLRNLHNARIDVNFELGGGRGWAKARDLISKLFLVKCPRDIIIGEKRANSPPLQLQ